MHCLWCFGQNVRSLPLLVAAMVAAAAASQRPNVHVSPRPDSPANPDVTIGTGRMETSYAGQLDPFQRRSAQILNAFSGRFELDSGGVQCFYHVLLTGYHMMQDAQTVKFFRDEKFNIFISDGEGRVINANHQVSAFQHQMIINDTDTYETCIVNLGEKKIVAYSSYRFVPPELLNLDTNGIMKLHNFSDIAKASLGQLELCMATVLANVRSHSDVYKDTASLTATNDSILQKALGTAALQLASLALTTWFIRRLFKTPVGKFAVAT